MLYLLRSRCGNALAMAGLLASLQACVVVPRTTEVYDPDCGIMTRQMDLEAVQVASIRGCRDRECGVLLAAAGATAAASAVISGSIVIVGNVVYWFEKQGRCVRETTP
jgi:hypothetical protein